MGELEVSLEFGVRFPLTMSYGNLHLTVIPVKTGIQSFVLSTLLTGYPLLRG